MSEAAAVLSYTGPEKRGLRPDVILTNSRGVFGVPGAEQAMALAFALVRDIKRHVLQQQNRVWKRNPEALEITGSIVGIIGLGDIGTEAARRFHGVGCRVLGVRRRPGDGKPPFVEAVYDVSRIAEVVKASNILVMALPGTEETRGLLSANLIDMMPLRSLFINVGRGTTVDEDALVTALKGGRIAGAGLDVTWTEPLPEDSPLWEMPNVIVASHSVGVSPNKNARRLTLFEDNLKRFLAGEPMRNVVDRTRGY